MSAAGSGDQVPSPTVRSVARVLLTIYAVTLTAIALWPVPVDSGASGFLRRVERVLPLMTYQRVEFASNIVLFIPLGLLLMLILRRRYLILPIAIVVTVGIESAQGLLLDRRTPSMLDIIANTAGACIGMLIVAVVESRRARRGAAPSSEERQEQEVAAWAALGIGIAVPPRPAAPRPQAAAAAQEPPAPAAQEPPAPAAHAAPALGAPVAPPPAHRPPAQAGTPYPPPPPKPPLPPDVAASGRG